MAEVSGKNEAVATALAGQGTASESVSTPALSELKDESAQLTEAVGGNRAVVRGLQEHIDGIHKKTHDVEWRVITAEKAKASVATLLGQLADLGFAWRDVARLVQVSVPAVQKWRKGGKASGDSRQRLASLLAACELITNHYLVEEIASWFEMPLSSAAPVTPVDLYAVDRADLVFELASGQSDPEALLTEFDPGWRERYRSDFEVFEAGDGKRSIRMRG